MLMSLVKKVSSTFFMVVGFGEFHLVKVSIGICFVIFLTKHNI